MSTEAKRKGLAALLCAVMVWPAIHHGLVRAYDIDAWKLFGFAMYAVPARQVRVQVLPIMEGEPTRWVFSKPGRARIARFLDDRLHWGRLAPAETLGHDLLELEPRFDALEIRILTRRLERSDARLYFDEERTRVERAR